MNLYPVVDLCFAPGWQNVLVILISIGIKRAGICGGCLRIYSFLGQNKNVFFNDPVVTHRLVLYRVPLITLHPLHVFFKVFLISLFLKFCHLSWIRVTPFGFEGRHLGVKSWFQLIEHIFFLVIRINRVIIHFQTLSSLSLCPLRQNLLPILLKVLLKHHLFQSLLFLSFEHLFSFGLFLLIFLLHESLLLLSQHLINKLLGSFIDGGRRLFFPLRGILRRASFGND